MGFVLNVGDRISHDKFSCDCCIKYQENIKKKKKKLIGLYVMLIILSSKLVSLSL